MASYHPLKVSSIQVPSDSITIGPMHSNVLREKLRELESKMAASVARLEAEAEDFLDCHDLGEDRCEQEFQELRVRQQEQLDQELQEHQETMDRLYTLFQREWAENPTMPVEPPDSCKLVPENRYLASTLGLALQRALAEIVLFRPPDPIDYLAHWLYRHAGEMGFQKQKAIDAYMLRIAEEEEAVAQEKQRTMRREREQLREEERRRKEIFLRRSKEAEAEMPPTPLATCPETPEESDVTQTSNEPKLNHELSMIAERENSEDLETGRLTDSAKLRLRVEEEEAEPEQEMEQGKPEVGPEQDVTSAREGNDGTEEKEEQ